MFTIAFDDSDRLSSPLLLFFVLSSFTRSPLSKIIVRTLKKLFLLSLFVLFLQPTTSANLKHLLQHQFPIYLFIYIQYIFNQRVKIMIFSLWFKTVTQLASCSITSQLLQPPWLRGCTCCTLWLASFLWFTHINSAAWNKKI